MMLSVDGEKRGRFQHGPAGEVKKTNVAPAGFPLARRTRAGHPAAMPSATTFALVLVTAPNRRVARALAAAALQARLAACVNLVPALESHYWWQGRLVKGAEVLLILKTRRRLLRALEGLILVRHPYDTPEFVVLPLTGGSARYLAWLGASVRPETSPKRRRKRQG